MPRYASWGNMSNLHESNMAAKCPAYDPFLPITRANQTILNILITIKVNL